MTVKCVLDSDKFFIAAAYKERVHTSEELALQFNVSVRTINRICVEMGVNKLRFYRPRKQLELPITMEPSAEDIQIPEVPAPVVTPTSPARSFKDAILDFIAKTILHFKK